jgi:hypothetical protein
LISASGARSPMRGVDGVVAGVEAAEVLLSRLRRRDSSLSRSDCCRDRRALTNVLGAVSTGAENADELPMEVLVCHTNNMSTGNLRLSRFVVGLTRLSSPARPFGLWSMSPFEAMAKSCHSTGTTPCEPA